jgi:hypothetical protein
MKISINEDTELTPKLLQHIMDIQKFSAGIKRTIRNKIKEGIDCDDEWICYGSLDIHLEVDREAAGNPIGVFCYPTEIKGGDIFRSCLSEIEVQLHAPFTIGKPPN